MQKEEHLIKNACYSETKYYLCKRNNKRSLLGRKQRSQVARSFPNRYLFSCTNKVTSLFSTSCILRIILRCKSICFCSGWLRDGCVVSDGKRKKHANENLQSNKERRFGGKKMKPFSQGKQVWLRSVIPLRRATTSLFYHPGFCGSSYPRLL